MKLVVEVSLPGVSLPKHLSRRLVDERAVGVVAHRQQRAVQAAGQLRVVHGKGGLLRKGERVEERRDLSGRPVGGQPRQLGDDLVADLAVRGAARLRPLGAVDLAAGPPAVARTRHLTDRGLHTTDDPRADATSPGQQHSDHGDQDEGQPHVLRGGLAALAPQVHRMSVARGCAMNQSPLTPVFPAREAHLSIAHPDAKRPPVTASRKRCGEDGSAGPVARGAAGLDPARGVCKACVS